MISFEEAISRIHATPIQPCGTEYVSLMDATDRVLAETITAPFDNPAMPTSAMDGYAFGSADLEQDSLKMIGDNPAGSMPVQTVIPGTCIKTFTGSIMPEGSDTLIPVENVRLESECVWIEKPVSAGANVRVAGENFSKGALLLDEGTILKAPQVGLLASVDKVQVKVYTRPKVGIVTFGSELKDLGEAIEHPAQIKSINNHTLGSAAKALGAEVMQFGIIQDTPEESRRIIFEALNQVDLLLTSGGMSAGDYDFIKEILQETGVQQVFAGVKIKPGKPVAYYGGEKKHILGLPGFPNSALTTFLLFGTQIISALQGARGNLPLLEAQLRVPVRKKPGRMEFRACRYQIVDGRLEVNFNFNQGTSSALINSLCCPNLAFCLLASEQGRYEAGERVLILPVSGALGLLS